MIKTLSVRVRPLASVTIAFCELPATKVGIGVPSDEGIGVGGFIVRVGGLPAGFIVGLAEGITGWAEGWLVGKVGGRETGAGLGAMVPELFW